MAERIDAQRFAVAPTGQAVLPPCPRHAMDLDQLGHLRLGQVELMSQSPEPIRIPTDSGRPRRSTAAVYTRFVAPCYKSHHANVLPTLHSRAARSERGSTPSPHLVGIGAAVDICEDNKKGTLIPRRAGMPECIPAVASGSTNLTCPSDRPSLPQVWPERRLGLPVPTGTTTGAVTGSPIS